MCILVLSIFHFTHRNTVTHHAFVFINEKARNSWVEQFAESKKMDEGTIHNIHHIVVYVKKSIAFNFRVQHGPWQYDITAVICCFRPKADISIPNDLAVVPFWNAGE